MVRPLTTFVAFCRRNLLWLLLGLVALTAIGTWAGWQLWQEHRLRLGRRALERHDFAAASSHFEWCLGRRSDDVDLHLLAAQAARRGGNLKSAEDHLFACQQLGGVSDASALEWALLRAQRGEPAQVREFLQQQQGGDPARSALVLEATAQGALRKGDLPLALQSLDRLLDLQPDHFQGRFLRGRTWHGLKRWENARTDLGRAVELRPEAHEARRLFAEAAYELGYVAEAAAHFEYLLRHRPGDPDVLLALARCREDAHELDEAGRLIDEVLARRPQPVAALYEQGRLLLRRNQADRAEQVLARAVALAPKDRTGYALLQRALEAQGKDAAAKQCLAQSLEIEAEARRRAGPRTTMPN